MGLLYTPASSMRHPYAALHRPGRQADAVPRWRVPERRQGRSGRRPRVPRVPRRLRHRDVPPRDQDPLLAAQPRSADRLRARVRAVDRHGGRAARTRACRWSRSRRQRPLREFDVVGFSLQYELTFTNVLTMLDLGGHPAARRGSRAGRARSCSPAGRPPRTPSRWRRSSTPRSSARPRSCCRRSCSRGPRCASEIAAGRARAPMRSPSSRAGSRSTCPSLYATDVDEATGMVVVGAPLDPRVPARVGRAMVADLDEYPVPDRHAGAVRRGGVRARVRRDRARLHRGLPVLPGRHDLPAGARALAAVDRGRR